METLKCLHECVIVETTEKVAQYYYPAKEEWGDIFDWDAPILSVNEVECTDCGADVTEQFRKQIEGELGLSK